MASATATAASATATTASSAATMAATAAAAQTLHIEEVLALPVDDKGFTSEFDRDIVFRRLRSKLENRQCFDCHNRNPTWLSMTYGVFVCLTCSGNHRRMGTHISFVRSCELDKFTPEQLMRMELGGNGRALTFFKTHGTTKPDYHSKLAAKYKIALDKSCQQSLGLAKGERASSFDSVEPPSFKVASSESISASTPPQQQQSGKTTPFTITPAVDSVPQLPPPISKAMGVPRAAPQYYDSSSNSRMMMNGSSGAGGGGGLGNALMAHASATGGISGAKQVKAKKLDLDFDFDEALEEAATSSSSIVPTASSAETVQPSSGVVFHPPTVNSPPTVNNCYTHSAANDATVGLSPAMTGYGSTQTSIKPSSTSSTGLAPNSSNGGYVANSKYSNAKAISSADLFGGPGGQQTPAERLEMDARVRRFNDCKAISSDAFHAGDPSLVGNKDNVDDDTSAQISQFGEQARQGIQMFASGAQHTVTKARDWINNFIFEERSTTTTNNNAPMFR